MIFRTLFSVLFGIMAILNARLLFFTNIDATRRAFGDIGLYRVVWFQLLVMVMSAVIVYVLTLGYAQVRHPVIVACTLMAIVIVLTVMSSSMR